MHPIGFANKGPSSQSYGFTTNHVWMWELDYKESWVLKNWCFWTVVLEKTLESPLDCKEIQPVHPKGNQSWIFIGRTEAEAENNTLATWWEELIHSCNLLYFKVCFVWYEDCYSSFLLLPICMEYIFPSSPLSVYMCF